MVLTLGDKIRLARKGLGLTQKELAEKIGKKHNSISEWESNKTKPDIDSMESLCKVLEVTPGYFLSGSTDKLNTLPEEDISNAAIVAKVMNSQNLIDLVKNYLSISPKAQKSVEMLLDELSLQEKEKKQGT